MLGSSFFVLGSSLSFFASLSFSVRFQSHHGRRTKPVNEERRTLNEEP